MTNKSEPLKNKIRNNKDFITSNFYYIDIQDLYSAIEFYKKWRDISPRTFFKEYPEYQKEWLQYYASRNTSEYSAWDSFILNKAFADVMEVNGNSSHK